MIDIKKIGIASTIAIFSVPVMLGGCGQVADEERKVVQKAANATNKENVNHYYTGAITDPNIRYNCTRSPPDSFICVLKS
ncbi:hypothetical protein [Candidatus Liberibacter solanacearum]|uniref:Lipoprotein n=1 Tax=Candidatus Liberibacter solanacearum TaxID=556287 RepID=A0A1V2N728_9HYPH|nr:hypothetical protein [Candidatus Liberibacter solanacearum]ONI58718.1 hypothetical protein AYO25_03815 [Candidatus Liberibacter solanacearum]ONI59367.1 hypothetical protein AYJ09_03250 [Candidatus Liberibacter solanacearum]